MRRSTYLHILLLFAFVFAGCEAILFDDLSEMDQLSIHGEHYSFVQVNSSFIITLKQQQEFGVTIDAPAELIDGIEAKIVNDTLVITDTNSYKWSPSYKIPRLMLCFPNLPRMHIKAPVDMETDGTITQPSLRIVTTSHTGRVNLNVDMTSLTIVTGNTYDSGIFTVTGTATNASFWMRNSASLHALELNSPNLRVVNNSKGNSYVQANGKLRVTLNSYGNIFYQGTPSEIVIDELSSTGKLIPLD